MMYLVNYHRDTLCRICVVRSQPRKNAGHTALARHHDLDHADHV